MEHTPSPNGARRYVKVREAADVLGVSVRTVYRAADAGEIPGARKLLGRWLIPIAYLDQSPAPAAAELEEVSP